MQTYPDRMSESVEPGDSVLVLCSSFTGDESAACADLLTLDDPGRTDVLWVALADSPAERLTAWDHHVDERPSRAAVVSVDTDTRSHGGAVVDDSESASPLGGATVETVSDPANVTRIGIEIIERLTEWGEVRRDRPTALCFDSLTTLLQHVSVEEAFKFLHVLTSKSAAVEATGHYHLDPAAHDEATIATLAELFDAVYECGDSTEESR